MKRPYIILLGVALLFAVGLFIHFPGRKLAGEHIYSKTGVTDHPLNCLSCHLYISKNRLIRKFTEAGYYSPFNLAVSKDGSKLYIVAEEGDVLLIADTRANKVIHKIQVGKHPYRVILSKDEKFAYVSNQWSDNVSVIDLEQLKVTDSLKTAGGPAGLALSTDGKSLYTVNSYSSNLSVINLQTGEESKRITLGNNPTGIRLSPDGKALIVTSRRANFAPYGEPLKSELTFISDTNQRVTERRDVESVYMMENVSFTPEGDLAFVTMIRPKNLIPTIQVERGWMMTHGICIAEQKENGRLIQLLLDEPNAYYSDPYDVVITPDGKKAFISNSGVNVISVVDIDSVRKLISNSTPGTLKTYPNHLGISSMYVIARIPTGANPKGLALSPDGKLLYVAEHLEDRIAVINTQSLKTVNTIDLGGPRRITVFRQGRRLFNNAGHTFQTQYSCSTCHPDTHEDGLVYNMASKDMGRNITNTQSLREIGDTPPYKWSGKNQTVYRQDGIRFSTVLTRTEAFNYKDLDAIVAYIMRDVYYPPNLQYNPTGELTEMQLKGKAIFERTTDTRGNIIPPSNRCITCHPPPYYTNLKMADVGTLAASDDSMLLDTPHLNNIYASSPYLHDGRAESLEEIWTKYSPEDKHGVANDLTKIELNQLVEYLKTLSGPEYYKDPKEKYQAKFASH